MSKKELIVLILLFSSIYCYGQKYSDIALDEKICTSITFTDKIGVYKSLESNSSKGFSFVFFVVKLDFVKSQY